jgi:hypothetical protein
MLRRNAGDLAIEHGSTLMIEVNRLRLHLKGDVKTSHRMQGMGKAFTEIPDADRPQLEEIIRQLASDRPTRRSRRLREVRIY